MSKRSASPSSRPAKRLMEQMTTPDYIDANGTTDEPAAPPTTPSTLGYFQSKPRVAQVYQLQFHPRVEATINLDGNVPEVRFTSEDTAITFSAEDFLQLAEQSLDWPGYVVTLDHIRVEPHNGGCRLVQYQRAFDLPNVFELTEASTARLRTKLAAMTRHIRRLQATVQTIDRMFDLVILQYRREYIRLNSIGPIADQMEVLTRLVDGYASAWTLVQDFQRQCPTCPLQPYSLLTCVLAQKSHIAALLK